MNIYPNCYKPTPDADINPDALELEGVLKGLGLSPVRVGGGEHKVETLAILMPNGYPLFINRRCAWADRNKGFLHFFIMLPDNGQHAFIDKAIKALELVEPNNVSLKALNVKKLQARIDYYNAVLSKALELFKAGRDYVQGWRDRVAASGFKVWVSTIKAQGLDNFNCEVTSPCGRFTIELQATSASGYCSQSINYSGDTSWDTFLGLAQLGEEKGWFVIDFTGLTFTHPGFLMHGSRRAIDKWCRDTEKSLCAVGHIIKSEPCHAGVNLTARFVGVV